MKNERKRIDIKEFRELGYLQELNRCFLHPHGLALEVIVNDDGSETLGGVWDSRKDPEGIFFDFANSSNKKRTEDAKKKEYNIAQILRSRVQNRVLGLGFIVEPIKGESE